MAFNDLLFLCSYVRSAQKSRPSRKHHVILRLTICIEFSDLIIVEKSAVNFDNEQLKGKKESGNVHAFVCTRRRIVTG